MIRPANINDVRQIQDLLKQLDDDQAGKVPRDFVRITENARSDELILRAMEDESHEYLVAEEDELVIGFISVRRSSNPNLPIFRKREFAIVDDVFVNHRSRNRGIGRSLFAAAIQWAKKRGLDEVQTTVWTNEDAKRFYASMGFETIYERMALRIDK